MTERVSYLRELTKGFLRENPTLRLVLGTCPTLAISISVTGALGMGAAATAVLLCSNVVISALRSVIPDKVRIPAYITIIAGLVTVVQLLVKAFLPAIDAALGIYLPLITVNCIILGRADGYANSHNIPAAACDALGMGVGFTGALCLMGAVREVLGAGSFAGHSLPFWGTTVSPILIFLLPPGGFFVYGLLIAVANRISQKKGKPTAEEAGCAGCVCAASCPDGKKNKGGDTA
ncbi:MAG: electron transport complex subunit E [Oscillospiraceae bacterium]|jgi:electron transport complex protein RnfE|nr:electron transport complex subunit E [Oscillospiraceae bacterium]